MPVNEFIYRDITQWKNAPIHKLVLTDTASGDRFYFFNVTEDSSYEVNPTARKDGYGNDRVVGWRMIITLRLLQNNLSGMLEKLDTYQGNAMSACLELKPDGSASHGRIVSILLNSPVGVVWSVKKDKTGPVLELSVSKILISLYQNTAVTFWNDGVESIADPIS